MFDNNIYIKNTNIILTPELLKENPVIILYDNTINQISHIIYFYDNIFINLFIFANDDIKLCIDVKNKIYTFSLYNNKRYSADIFNNIYNKCIYTNFIKYFRVKTLSI